MSSAQFNRLPCTMTAPWTRPEPLPDIPGGEPNLLHRTAWSDPSNPLRLEFKPWYDSPPPEGEEIVGVFLDDDEGNIIATRTWALPMQADDYYIEISADRLPPGLHTLSFIMTNYAGVAARSFPYTVTIDKTPPVLAGTSELVFPSEVRPPYAITAAYLADPVNQDQVLATLPDYNEKKVGDVITWYWEQSPGGREAADTTTLQQGDIGQPLALPFSGDLLRRSANGVRYASYRVRDRAGNESVLSSDVQLTVNIRPPTPRKFPTVKEATSTPNGTGVLNPFRGAAGLTVVVEAAEIDPGETLTVDFVSLGGAGNAGSVTGLVPNTPGGLEFAIPASVVAANIPVKRDGRKVEVCYWVDQGTQSSATYTLSINGLLADQLGQITCHQAQIGSPATLSKSAVPARGADLEIGAWLYQASGQLMNVWVMAAEMRTDLLEAVPLIANGKFTTSLPKDYVNQRPLNSTFTVYASVSFDQGHSYHSFSSLPLKVIA